MKYIRLYNRYNNNNIDNNESCTLTTPSTYSPPPTITALMAVPNTANIIIEPRF